MKLSLIITEFVIGIGIIILSAFYASPKLIHICTSLICFGGLLEFYFSDKKERKETGNRWEWFISSQIKRDEREEMIWLRSNQISLIIGLCSAFYFYYSLLDQKYYEMFKYSWIYWCFGITIFSRSILLYVYSNFLKLEK